MGWMTEESAVIPGRRKRFFGSPERPYCARVKNLFIYTSVSAFEFMAWNIIKQRGNSPFTFIPILARLLTSWNPLGHSWPVTGLLYLLLARLYSFH